MNETKFSGLLGICRKAGKMSVGHDAAKDSIRNNRAFLCILAADASERLGREFGSLCGERTPVLKAPFMIEQFEKIIGLKAAVITVDDEGFATKLMTYREDNV
jgi:ribosomal protein L7Ae-like RNA K-turn-binding protein